MAGEMVPIIPDFPEVGETEAINAIIDLAMSLANDLEINTCTLLDRAAITAKHTDAAP